MFIAGGAGAIGTLTIQIAHRRGWRVAASASAHNHDYMRSLGAEVVVDYHDDHWPDQITEWMVGGVDAAIAIHPGTTSECLPVVQDGGQVVTVSGDSAASARGIRIGMIDYKSDVGAELARMLDEVSSRTLHLEIERVYPFDEAEAALSRVQTRHVRGKLVIRLQ